MARWPATRIVRFALAAVMLLPGGVGAQPVDPSTPVPGATPPPAPTDTLEAPGVPQLTVDEALDEARESIKTGDYDGTIALLKDALERSRSNPAQLEQAYLLLIKTHVFQGNDNKFKPQGRTMSELSYAEARRLTIEALQVSELRHMRPEPVTDYPPEMVRLFEDVRREIFGGIRVREVTPPDAVVFFDGDTLGLLPDEAALGLTDVPQGVHIVQVVRDGYETITDRVVIAPNSMIDRSYTMQKRRGTGWYATRVGIGLALVGGIAAAFLAGETSTEDPPPQPLPGPPPPPGATR